MIGAVPEALAHLRWGIARYASGDLTPVASERTGFAGGARWMARAMGRTIDEAAVRRAARGGLVKYGAALAAGLGASAIMCRVHVVAGLAAFVLAFYAVEVQGLFLVPLVVDGARAPLTGSRRLLERGGGTWRAVAGVLPIAGWMILAGPFRGFTRSWCEGCLAVVRWYGALAGVASDA